MGLDSPLEVELYTSMNGSVTKNELL